MEKQIRKNKERNITEIIGANGSTYQVLISIAGVKYDKTFKTLEEARKYLNNSKMYATRKDIDWPYNLIDELFPNTETLDYDYVLENFEKNFNFILNSLTIREAEILDGYYKKGYLLDSLALQYEISRTRVQQIIHKALRKIKHPSRCAYLKYGIEFKQKQDNVERLKMELDIEINRLNDLIYHKRDIIRKLKIEIDEEIETESNILCRNFHELDFSCRTYNCLKRAGIKTIGDLISKSEKDMMKVRNLGRKSLKEIKEKLEALGLGFNKD